MTSLSAGCAIAFFALWLRSNFIADTLEWRNVEPLATRFVALASANGSCGLRISECHFVAESSPELLHALRGNVVPGFSRRSDNKLREHVTTNEWGFLWRRHHVDNGAMRLTTFEVSAPHLAIVLGAGILPLWRLIVWRRSVVRRRRSGVTCPECGYDLRGAHMRGCPECGTAIPSHLYARLLQLRNDKGGADGHR
jgi:hypothetical protein